MSRHRYGPSHLSIGVTLLIGALFGLFIFSSLLYFVVSSLVASLDPYFGGP